MLTKPSPLLGYNNNVRHGGRLFHIQTEDSGVRYGHVISHVFADGGRILKSVKTSYAKYVGDDRMVEVVREMMRQQHKAMFIALRDGVFDALVDGRSASTSHPPPTTGSSGALGSTSGGQGDESATDAPPSACRPVGCVVASAENAAGADSGLSPRLRVGDPDALMAAGIERSVERLAASSWLAEELPPPPHYLFRDKAGEIDSRPGATAKPSIVRPMAAPMTPPGAPSPGVAPLQSVSARRYASTRPASIFGQARPQTGASLFGADVARDPLLDEVILSFLGADEEPSGK
ncbi:MAG: hypothetical protein ABTD50_18805 [Polyangiaceae bacterium]|jgi:hypothetical protein